MMKYKIAAHAKGVLAMTHIYLFAPPFVKGGREGFER